MTKPKDRQTIQSERQEPTYYAMIPKMATLDLDPYELALYCNYKQTTGEFGQCTKSNATLAQECRMSITRMKAARISLETRGYIRIETHADGNGFQSVPPTVIVRDVWALNHQLFSQQKAIGGVSPHDTKEEPDKKNQKEERDSSPLPPNIGKALDTVTVDAWSPDDNDTVLQMQADALVQAFERAHRESGAPSSVRRGKNVYKSAIQYYKDGYRSEEVYATVRQLIDQQRPTAFVFIGEALAAHRIKASSVIGAKLDDSIVPDDWGVTSGMRSAVVGGKL